MNLRFDPNDAPWGSVRAQPVMTSGREGPFRVWDEPQDGAQYVVGVDFAEGKQRDLGASSRKPGFNLLRDRPDNSAAIVIEVESGQHVATWRGHAEPSEMAGVVVAIGCIYNQAMIVPEINSQGLGAVDVMVKVFRYPNIYRAKLWNRAQINDWVRQEFGWRTNDITRGVLMTRIMEWVRHSPYTRDEVLVTELRTMEMDEQGRPRARGRNKDDTVLALGMALQGRFELLFGKVAPEVSKADPLPGYDRAVWDRVHKQQKEGSDARRLGHSLGSSRLSSLPRPRPLPRW